MMRRAGRVLLVEPERAERERLGAILADAGFEVTPCPGPSEPDYTCVGDRSGRCPLVGVVDVVVLDVALPGEALMEGTTADVLLDLYLNAGRPVVALGARPGRADPHGDEPLVRLARNPEQAEVLAAIRRLTRVGSGGAGGV